jgi:iron complex outermembrane receptor protein
MNMRFTLSDKLLLTIDPSVQYVKANGGGTTTASEATCTACAAPPPATSAAPIIGQDLNGDGDLDTVTLWRPATPRPGAWADRLAALQDRR